MQLANWSVDKPIEKYFKNIADSIYEANSKGIHFAESYVLNEEHLVYLNKYENGVLFYEKPNPIAFSLNDKSFAELFKMMINDELEDFDKPKNHVESLKTTIKNKLKGRLVLKTKADIEYTVKPSIVKDVFSEIELDYITVNGAINAGMHIDFNTSSNTIANHIYEYFGLANALSKMNLNRKRTSEPIYNIYFNTPEGKEQKELLDKMMNVKSIEGIVVKELDAIDKDIDAIEKSDKYVPFSSVI
jgi:hypothetical protein